MTDTRADAAIRAGHDILAADELRVAHETLRDQVGMLDDIGAMADDAGDQHRILGPFHILEDGPFMLVPRIRGFDRVGARAHRKNDIDDVAQGDVLDMRAMRAAPADVKSNLLARY